MNRYSRNKMKRLLDLSKPLFVRRRLETRGHAFGLGEELPWRKIGISQASVERWFRLRMLSHNPEGDLDPRHSAGVQEMRRITGITDENGLRLDGPTLEEFVQAGYPKESYPPDGWAVRPSPGYDAYLEQLTAPSGE